VSVFDRLAEQRIADAMAKGVFDDLPGAGRPLALQDLSQVPEHLRAGYLLLKNAGFLPPEVEALRDLRTAEALVQQIQDPVRRRKELKRLRLLELRLQEGGRRSRPGE
jgi:hypothetical protein